MASVTRVKLPVKDTVADVLMWRDVKKTGIIFGGATLAFLFLQYGKYSFISLLAYGMSAAVFAMLFWNIVGGIVKRPPPPLPRALTEGIPEAQLRTYADKATPIINSGLLQAKRALDGSSPLFSLGVAGGCFFAGKIAASMSLLAMAYLPLLAAFTLPKVYEMKKDEIDQGLTVGREKATAVHDKYLAAILSKIPRAQAPSPAESSSMRKME